tara:strand:- start:739 stop:2061 length:1323 start_codon:yes stop_codon:yes gene_type:complete
MEDDTLLHLHEYNDLIIEKYLLDENEILNLNETIYLICEYYINLDPLNISSYYFTNTLINYVCEIFKNQFSFLKFEENEIYSLIYYNLIYYCSINKHSPMRCNGNTTNFNNLLLESNELQEKIENLINKEQPEQRTEQWYKYRHNLLTASNIWMVFGTDSQRNRLLEEKLCPLNLEKHNRININTPMHHGNKYEDLSIMFYEYFFETKVDDFGCIQHDNYKFLGASPDGINVNKNSNKYGTMLEIKNVTTREITGIPKEDYWIQMQLQLEVCNLDNCDFLETKFTEYQDFDEFINDQEKVLGLNKEKIINDDINSLLNTKGMVVFHIKNSKCIYDFMPLHITNIEDCDKWKNSIMYKYEEDNECMWMSNIYWKLENISCVLVLRNKLWFKNAIIKLEEFWELLEKEKLNGTKIVKKIKKNKKEKGKGKSQCFIQIDTSTC